MSKKVSSGSNYNFIWNKYDCSAVFSTRTWNSISHSISICRTPSLHFRFSFSHATRSLVRSIALLRPLFIYALSFGVSAFESFNHGILMKGKQRLCKKIRNVKLKKKQLTHGERTVKLKIFRQKYIVTVAFRINFLSNNSLKSHNLHTKKRVYKATANRHYISVWKYI